MAFKNRKIIRLLLTTLWIAIGAGTIVLLVAAARKKDAKRCSGIYINIHGVSNNFFVDKKDIMDSITAIVGADPIGEKVGSFDLEKMENGLTGNIWVKSAQLFFDNNELLQVNVFEREPVARIFTRVGTTFYIDSSTAMLPLSEKFSARLPVFTDFPSDNATATSVENGLLHNIRDISLAIQKDSFSMAMIDQIDITPQETFEMVPKIGNQVIIFGDGNDIEEKLHNLQLFYQKVITKTGWNYYSSIDLEYKGQIVGKRKGAADYATDSLKTIQLLQAIAANAKKHSEDSIQTTADDNSNEIDSSVIQRSEERDDETIDSADVEQAAPQMAAPVTKPIVPSVPAMVKPKEVKPVVKPEAKQKMVAVLPKTKQLAKPVKKQVATKPAVVIKKPAVATKPKPAAVKPKAVSMSPKEKAQNNDY